jgi:hypothetical protein
MLNSDLFHPKNDVHEVETCSATMNWNTENQLQNLPRHFALHRTAHSPTITIYITITTLCVISHSAFRNDNNLRTSASGSSWTVLCLCFQMKHCNRKRCDKSYSALQTCRLRKFRFHMAAPYNRCVYIA